MKLFQIYNRDGTWSETANDHSHDGIKRNGVFYYDDTSELSILLNDFFVYPRAGASLTRTSIDHIQFGALSYSPSTGIIIFDGRVQQRASGLDAFRALVDFNYPEPVRYTRHQPRKITATRIKSDALH
jgi:hypothetical protein